MQVGRRPGWRLPGQHTHELTSCCWMIRSAQWTPKSAASFSRSAWDPRASCRCLALTPLLLAVLAPLLLAALTPLLLAALTPLLLAALTPLLLAVPSYVGFCSTKPALPKDPAVASQTCCNCNMHIHLLTWMMPILHSDRVTCVCTLRLSLW